MVLEISIQIATLISVVTGFASLVYFVNSFRREINMQVVIHFSERFEKVLDTFPDDFFIKDYSTEELPPRSMEMTKKIIKYLNLTAEEHYLYHRKYMSKELWQRWEKDIRGTLNHPMIKREWEELNSQMNPTPEFRKFIESCFNKI